MRVRLLPAAENSIDEMAGWMAQYNLDAAHRFYFAIDDAISMIREYPKIGSPVALSRVAHLRLRKWPIPNYPDRMVFTAWWKIAWTLWM